MAGVGEEWHSMTSRAGNGLGHNSCSSNLSARTGGMGGGEEYTGAREKGVGTRTRHV